VLGQCASLAHLDPDVSDTPCVKVPVAGVCVVEFHEDCIEYHSGQSAEQGNEGRLLPPLDALVDRDHRLRGHVYTVTDGLTRV
jgi:hypothetical protein